MGIGKSTAIRTLCGELAVDCDVENLDPTRPDKIMTTVGADYGVIELDDEQPLHIYGSPGQERFAFMRDWLMSLAIGAIVLVDLHAAEALVDSVALVRELEATPGAPMVMVVIARPAEPEEIDRFADTLAESIGWAVPTLAADPRDREQMLSVLSVLISMISIENDYTQKD